MTTTEIAELPLLEPGSPPAELDRLRELGWAARSERGLEVLRHDECHAVLKHPLLRTRWSERLDAFELREGPVREMWDRMLISSQGPARKRLRRPLSRLLSPRTSESLRDVSREIAEDLADEIADGDTADLLEAVAWQLPPRMYCHLVSADKRFAATAAALSDGIISPILTVDLSRQQESVDALIEARRFAAEHIRARSAELGDDFTSRLIREQEKSGLSDAELVDEAVTLMAASIDNTVHQIAIAFGVLLEERSRWESLLREPGGVEAAVDETIRLRPRFGSILRVPIEDVDLFGVHVPAGSQVHVNVRAAQRDPRAFGDATDTFVADRQSTGQHVMFGNGQYSCIGRFLARIEVQECVSVFLERFPDLRLDGDWTVRHTPVVSEVTSLKVRLR
ncbi:cytochrome P450 [Pseudonocardia pini]|uniref:cytochrome P450 n=1 Tax=Pseudonocardia pini TaxID=2758030 RepID=UPI0015EFF215|nr:cytochrome P450 [Pseudonocardia pini]